MAYARQNWTIHEVRSITQNPVHSSGGPHAHSRIHSTRGELANHPLFQKARVTANVIQVADRRTRITNNDGTRRNVRRGERYSTPDAHIHSTLDDGLISVALCNALNHVNMQVKLNELDAGQDVRVMVNFTNSIGDGLVHSINGGTVPTPMVRLFVYLKPNPGNKDLPIVQTVVPHGTHAVGANTIQV